MNASRKESEVFKDLAALCREPGYMHALAYLCFRDNVIFHSGKLRDRDLEGMFSPSRLIRTELATLFGLLMKAPIDWTLPSPRTTQDYVDRSDTLLSELHDSLSSECWSGVTAESIAGGANPFERGEVLREPIFYAGESAYNFQYLDLAVRKYAADSEILASEYGFTVKQATVVARAIDEVQGDRLETAAKHLRKTRLDAITATSFFLFTIDEVAAKTSLPASIVENVLNQFTLLDSESNPTFNALSDYNVVTVRPILKTPTGELLLLHGYSLAEAIYEGPHHWLYQLPQYRQTLATNRGQFTEHFVAERLTRVFGADHVHSSVELERSKGSRLSEIDVLVIWGDRVIVVQAKSKRLTLASRKGNDQIIRDDFRRAVQDSYDQGLTCARALVAGGIRVLSPDGRPVDVPERIKDAYILCIVVDHYPALSFQARQFLKAESDSIVQLPLVTDVFALDAMTEMLDSPLHLLSYFNLRAKYSDRLLASQELTILAYHLKRNLWVSAEVSMLHVADDFSSSLDIAMAVRRTGIPGEAVPDGVLTRFRHTTLGRIIDAIEARPERATIALGLLILSLSEQATTEMSSAVNLIAARSRTDHRTHDITFTFNEGIGITFLCSDEKLDAAARGMKAYCERRKYVQKAYQWFGLCMSSKGPHLRFGLFLDYPWQSDESMEERTRHMKAAGPMDKELLGLINRKSKKRKTGRNELCPCGSGRKFKMCCLNRNDR